MTVSVRDYTENTAALRTAAPDERVQSTSDMRTLAMLVLVASLPYTSGAQTCDELQSFPSFDTVSAMKAVFCAYDREKDGTLLPVEFTMPWTPEKAETLATPVLALSYQEAGIQKGVLVVQRQMMFEGEPATGHAQTAIVSVYVFRRTGARWSIERREDEALDIGARGVAPTPELIRIGRERYGLWFRGGNMGQGYTSEYAHLVTISGPLIAAAGQFELGEGNSGACSNDPRERNDSIHACWEWSTTMDFVRLSGRDDYMLRLTSAGTFAPDVNAPDRVAAKKSVTCYLNDAGTYTSRTDPRCASYPAVDTREIFGTP
jgi:hypothetical protein